MATKKSTRKVARKAGDGTFTTKKYAQKHPGTTVIETVPVRKKGGKKSGKKR